MKPRCAPVFDKSLILQISQIFSDQLLTVAKKCLCGWPAGVQTRNSFAYVFTE